MLFFNSFSVRKGVMKMIDERIKASQAVVDAEVERLDKHEEKAIEALKAKTLQDKHDVLTSAINNILK